MTKRARLIYNPVSGHEQNIRNVASILDILESDDDEYLYINNPLDKF